MLSTSLTRADQYASPSLSAAWRARRAFSPREAWKIEMDLDSEIVRSKNRGLCRVCLVLPGAEDSDVDGVHGADVVAC
jgi:hypothetical protein